MICHKVFLSPDAQADLFSLYCVSKEVSLGGAIIRIYPVVRVPDLIPVASSYEVGTVGGIVEGMLPLRFRARALWKAFSSSGTKVWVLADW